MRPRCAAWRRRSQLRPEPLWELAQDSWSAPDVPWTVGPDVTIERLTNHYPEHCYILSLPSGETLIVDPGAEPERVLQAATRDGRRPLGILVTHRHQDHTGAVVPVQAATGAPVFVHAEDVEGVQGVPSGAVRTFGADGALEVQPFQVHTLHTPGHTPGSATFVAAPGRRRRRVLRRYAVRRVGRQPPRRLRGLARLAAPQAGRTALRDGLLSRARAVHHPGQRAGA